MATTDPDAIIELLKAVFSVRPVSMLYDVEQLRLLESLTRVEAESNTSTVTLRVVGGDEKRRTDPSSR
jgi:hypothetical protein